MVCLLTLFSPDITVELSNRDDCFLMDISHLTLKLKFEDQAIQNLDLISHDSRPGVWYASHNVVLYAIDSTFLVAHSR
jgi:hypothetical protein